MECVHDTPGSDHIVVASSRFISCPVESFFAQGTSQTNILVENNYFIGGGPLKFDCTTNPGCVNSGITVRYNSFAGTFLNLQNACNANGTCTGATIDHNARLCQRRRRLSPASASASTAPPAAAGRALTTSKRSPRAASASATRRSRFAVPARVRLAGAAGVRPPPPARAPLRLHAGDPASHPARDIQGLLRPLRVAPAAGAAQNETAELDVGRSVGAVALGMSATDVATAYGLKSPAATTDKPRVVHYRVDGRDVWLRYVRGVVAGIETTSPYYTTLAGWAWALPRPTPSPPASSGTSSAGRRIAASGGSRHVPRSSRRYRGNAARSRSDRSHGTG